MRYADITVHRGQGASLVSKRCSAHVQHVEAIEQHILKCAITDYTIALSAGQRAIGLFPAVMGREAGVCRCRHDHTKYSHLISF
jgi:hypothetical protein